jgi:hypothetical protein
VGLRAAAKALVETVIRRDIKTIEPDSIALIAKHQRHTAWFCHDLQLQWFLDTRQVDLVIDVGANEGQFVRLSLLKSRSATWFAYLPETQTRDCDEWSGSERRSCLSSGGKV